MDPVLLEALRRGSGLRLSAEGELSFQDEPVTHPRVQDLFHRGVSVRADGEVILQVGTQWAYLECETVAHFVDSVAVRDGALEISLRGTQERRCTGPRIGMAPDDRFYLWAEVGDAPAVLTRKAHHQVSELLRDDGAGGAVLDLGDSHVVVESLDARPGPSDRWMSKDRP